MNDENTSICRSVEETGPAWRRIADDLAASLARDAVGPGTALPTAQDVAQRYGVNRHTARQAYLHLQSLGLVEIRKGCGPFSTGELLPYRLGRRVRFRENLGASRLEARTRIQGCAIVPAEHGKRPGLACVRGEPLWCIDTINHAGGEPLSLGRHVLSAVRFPGFDAILAQVDGSFTAAFRRFGIADYQRRSTRIAARLAQASEAERLGIATGAAILVTRSLDVGADGTPLQEIEALFRGDRIEMVVETD